MLSTKPIKNVAQAAHYFLAQDNYYTEGNPLAQEHSQWWGKGAEALGLSGRVDPQQFTDLLQGHLPGGQQLGKKVDGEIVHRPGVDLTFSVPKSVSILGLLGEDERVLKAVETATDKVLSLIEREQAKTRVRANGVLMAERTGQLVVARFLHDLSREGDPQLHTHCVVMNMTLRKDGQWRSLASKLGHYAQNTPDAPEGFLESVRHYQKYYGAVFRAELAYEMKQLGYTVEKTGPYGFFEIAGISRESLAVYSQRRRDIEAYLESHGLSGAKAAELATLNTRRAKQAIQREELKTRWETKAALRGLLSFEEARSTVAQARQCAAMSSPEPTQPIPPEMSERATLAMREAIAHLSETQVALKETELLARAIYYSVGEVPVAHLTPALQAAQQAGELIPLTTDGKGERHFTTPALLGYEKALLQASAQSHASHRPMVEASLLKIFLQNHGDLTHEQKQAIRTLFSSDKLITVLAGPSGSGKTHLIGPMMTLAQLGGYQPVLLTAKQAEMVDIQKQIQKAPANLRERLQGLWNNKQFDTVFGYLRKNQETPSALESWFQKNIHSPKKPVLFIDNAIQCSSRQLSELVAHAQRLQGWVVAIGDPQTALSWRAGTPLTQLLAHGVVAAQLTGNQRKMTAPLKTALDHSLQKNIAAAFQQIGQRLISVEDPQQRHSMMAAQVAGLSPEDRTRTLVLAPTQAAAHELNVAIREALKTSGAMDKTELSLTVLLPHYLRLAEQHTARHYRAGQWIRFHQDYRSLRVHRGDYCRIQGIDQKANELLLENQKGPVRRWNPEKSPEGAIEVFDEKIRAIAAGDTLLCHRSNKQRGLVKGDRVSVMAVTEKQITLRHESGKLLPTWPLSERSSRHWDYGVALTPLQASHRHPEIVIAYQNSHARQSHQRAFYHVLAQASAQAWIYTENSAQLLKTLQKHTGDKLTAMESVLHHVGAPSNSNDSSSDMAAADYLRILEVAVEKALQRLSPPSDQSRPDATDLAAKEAVRYALAYLSEKEAAFEHKEVVTVALTHVLGEVNLQALQQAVMAAEKRGELIRGVVSVNGTHWTTREALALERDIVALAQQDRGTLPARISAETVNAYLEKNPTSDEHARVLRELSVKTDRIVLLQGFAGTGKTTLLQHVEQLQHIHGALQQNQHALLCLAPTHAAVKEIRARGLAGVTLDRFLLNYAAGKITPETCRGRCLIVDESSMISNQRIRDFLKAVIHLESWAMLVGDRHQYASPDAGKPFAILQQTGLTPLRLTHITRQKDETLKVAVQALYQKDFPRVFQLLEKRIVEVGGYLDEKGKHRDNREERLERIAADYLDRDVMRRAQTQIITFGNVDRVLQNDLIREGLSMRGELTGDAVLTDILVSRQLSEIERSQVRHYHRGDVLRFNLSQTAAGIRKGDYWTVADIFVEQNRLQLERPGRDPVLWKPRPWKSGARAGVEVYQRDSRELQAGDLIRWTRTDEALGLLSPEVARVESVVAEKMGKMEKTADPDPQKSARVVVRSLQLTDQGLAPCGKPIELSIHNPRMQHWDHAYAMTGYSAQGKTISEVIINAESYRPQLTSQPSLLVALTRAVDQLTLYTDNKTQLLRAVRSNPGHKSSALEIMGEIPKPSPKTAPRPEPVLSSDRRGYDQAATPFFPDERAELTRDSPGDAGRFAPMSKDSRTDLKPVKPVEPRLDAQRISHWLTDQAEGVVERLLGEPKSKTGGQYRYGSKQGSLMVTMSGEKRGLWYDFQTDEGGHLLKLIALKKDLDIQRDFQAVLREALTLLGTSPADISVQETALTASPQKPIKPPTAALSAPTPEQERSLRYARRLARESHPVAGTLAERYLRDHRGIDLEKFPGSVRFHPGIYSRQNEALHPALLVVAKDSADQVQAVQAIFLDKETAQKADVPVKKQTWGQPSKGSVALETAKSGRPSPGITYLAEGPETALSVYAALKGADVRITLGKSNFKNIDPAKTSQNIVLCLDNDGQAPQSDRLIHFAASQLQAQGKTVWIAQPKIEGQDYNDVLKQQGQAAVKAELQQAISYADYRDQSVSGKTLQAAMNRQWSVAPVREPWESIVKEGGLPDIPALMNSDQPTTAITRDEKTTPSPPVTQKTPVKIEKEPELDM